MRMRLSVQDVEDVAVGGAILGTGGGGGPYVGNCWRSGPSRNTDLRR